MEDKTIYTGYYDETAKKLMGRKLKEGRMPEKAGEIAAERSALIRLDHENAAVGETLKLTMSFYVITLNSMTLLIYTSSTEDSEISYSMNWRKLK